MPCPNGRSRRTAAGEEVLTVYRMTQLELVYCDRVTRFDPKL
jgi:hypothetical protein